MNPLISVVIPTYNRPELLKRAIRSVQAQTYTELDIWVVGDACPALDSIRKLEEFADVNFFNFKRNHHDGGAAGRNWGILHSEGVFISYLDDDNYFLPNHLSSILEAMIDKQATWGFSSMQANGKDFQFWTPVKSGIDTSAVIHPRDFAAEYGMWLSREVDFCHDWEFFSRFVKAGEPWVATKEPTLVYNVDTCGAKAWFEQKLRTLPLVK